MRDMFNSFLSYNSINEYLTAAIIFVGGTIIVLILKKIIFTRLKKRIESDDSGSAEQTIKTSGKSIFPFFIFLSFYLAVKTLALPDVFDKGFGIISVVIFTFIIARTLTSTIQIALQKYIKEPDDSQKRSNQFKAIKVLLNLIIWAVALVFLLDNIGVEISAVVAGLGIGGIAVALAAQTILGDLFSYFVILFDRPFEIGDFIIVNDKMGVVDYIGIKTTRIRAIGGEQLVLSNTDLTNSRIHNYKKMEKRRVVFKIGVVYQTPVEKLKMIPELVKAIIEKNGDVTFDRAHFASYGDFSLNFEFVYYVTGADYVKYMDTQQRINLDIFESFKEHDIDFAYPSQTVFMGRSE